MFVRYILLLFSLVTFSYATISIEENIERLDDFPISYYYDETRSLNIDEIQNVKFKENIPSQFTFGYVKGNGWFKLEIQNNTQNNTFVLYFTEAFFQEVNLFESQQYGWKKHSNGLYVDLKDRDIKDSNPAFYLNIEPGNTKTYYIQTYSEFGQHGEFQIFQENDFLMHNKLGVFALYMFYFGSLFIIIIFNTFLYLAIREPIYLYYVGYTFFYSVFVLGFSGLSIYLGLGEWYHELSLSIPIFVIFLILFTNEYLHIKRYLPRIYKILNIFIWIMLALLILASINLNPWFEILTFVGVIPSILLMYAAIYLLIKGHAEAMYYVIVMLVYRVTMIFVVLLKSGLIENSDIYRYSFLFGSFFEIVFFSLMLANRFHVMKDQKIYIQNELIDLKEENEQYLKKEVSKRTEEITKINQELTEVAEEKELLLKEVCHRVKNNFQMVVSLLSIEANKDKNEEHRQAFAELTNRIKSMSSIHQFIYDTHKISKIQSKSYILKLLDEIKKIYEEHSINIHAEIDDCILSMDEALALGVIISEVTTNAVKHHNEKERCTIDINFKCSRNSVYLSIHDNGLGFSPEMKNSSEGLGLKLIDQFSRKLINSKIEYLFENGTKFVLIFELFSSLSKKE